MLRSFSKRQEAADTNHILQHLSSPTMECRRNYSVSSCNHVVHYRCLKKMISSTNARRFALVTNDFVCPVCRRLIDHIYPLLFSPTVNRAFRRFDSLDGLLRKYSSAVQNSVLSVGVVAADHPQSISSLADYPNKVPTMRKCK